MAVQCPVLTPEPTCCFSKPLPPGISTHLKHANVLKGMSHPPVPKELLFFHKSWFLLLFSKHNSDVYPTCLKLSREPSDLADGNGNGTAAVEGPLAAPQKIYT